MSIVKEPLIPSMEQAWGDFSSKLKRSERLENTVANRTGPSMTIDELLDITKGTMNTLKESYLEFLAKEPIQDLSDDALRRFARYTDGLPLKDFENCLDLVPQLVNLVSLADAIPTDGSSLPFNLRMISSKVDTAVFFAPKRFTAVQFAFDEPRSRVLLFRTCFAPLFLSLSALNLCTTQRGVLFADTGRVVGTGTRTLSNQHRPVHALS